ncbi:MAG: hypothetical protein WAW36_19025 [Methylovulum miyakonense]|uniref:hypothetical protein n=1 Tax=Methylovulum miyakonense TaxID=645578 RepID=UPI003BB5D9B4
MTSEKTKTTERWVANGMIRFAGRTFNPPELIPHNNSIVYVGYDTFVDNTIDILDENMDIVVQCPNRIAAPTNAAVRPEPLAEWEAEAIRLYQPPLDMKLCDVVTTLQRVYGGIINKRKVHDLLEARGLV